MNKGEYMKKTFFIILFISVVNSYALNISFIDTTTDRGSSFYNSIINDNSYIRAIFVGDVMLSRYVEDSVYNNFNGDYRNLFTRVEPFLRGADIVFGNLENPVTDEKMNIIDNTLPLIQHPFGGFRSLSNICCNFGAEVQALDALKWAGFNVVNIANNHIGDAGIKGIEDTIYNLRNIGINYVGGGLNANESHNPYVFNKNDVKIGLLGYSNIKSSEIWKSTETRAGISIYNDNDVKKDLMLTKNSSDIIIVSIHFGEEGDKSPDGNEIEIAHSIIDNGASIVIGHHPHVVQPVELYHSGLIAYSLGNFIFDEDSYDKSVGLLLELFVDNKKNIYVIPRNIIISYSHQAVIQF
jgi:poly-gamma-glutamate synthesis protein (capsule biosynthesis protein)